MTVTAPSLPRATQSAVGLALAAALFAAWLGLHLFAMFGFELGWATAPAGLAIALAFCWLSVGLFIVSHDAMHGSLAPGRPRLNGMVGAALLFVYAGFGWRRMRAAHFDHHRLAGREGDPDFDARNPASALRWYTTFLRRYFGAGSLLYVSTIVAMYWLVFDVPWQNIVFLYGLPAIASSMQLFYFGTFRPHRHEDAGPDFEDGHNARSERFGTLASLASCFHFGYHLEHHRHPQVPWWRLPRTRRQPAAAR